MSSLSTFANPAPYHILSYGTLLGTSLYQSFVNGIVSYRALPRPQFATLQAQLTPVYFAIQTALPVIMALTYPGRRLPSSSPLLSPTSSSSSFSPSSSSSSSSQGGIFGVLAPENRSTVLAPILGMFVTAAVNWAYLGPVTTRIMKERKHQETRDGKKYHEPGEQSQAMKALNGRFARLHGLSAAINLVGAGVMVWYGGLLAERLV